MNFIIEKLKKRIQEYYPDGLEFSETEKRFLCKDLDGHESIFDKDYERVFGMLKLSNGKFIFLDKIANKETEDKIVGKIKEFIRKFYFVEIEALFEQCRYDIEIIDNKDDFALYLQKISSDTHIAKKKFLLRNSKSEYNSGKNYYKKDDDWILDKSYFIKQIEKIVDDEGNGEISQKEIFDRFLHLLPKTIIEWLKSSEKLVEIKIGDIAFFRNKDLLISSLPDDFCLILNMKIEDLQSFKLLVDENNINVALSLHYDCNFRIEYNLEDTDLFYNVINKNLDNEKKSAIYFEKRKRNRNKNV